ncbi:MAG: Crp/Fnr family transcriptional regulator [Thermaurantimonas sp.]|uniref:Crp/Fnr family transcriptional regulator n=1 Tax=Thermaurantimonas sp. TaxID=2681568 RepID=UPI00391C7C76
MKESFSFASFPGSVMKDKEQFIKDNFNKLLPEGSHILLQYFISSGDIKIFKIGEEILKKGEPSDKFYWLIEGGVKSYRNGELILHKNGDFLGISAAIQDMPILYNYSCISELSVLLELPTKKLHELMTREPQAVFPIMQVIFKKAELTEQNGVQIIQADSEGRLLQVLKYLISKYGLTEDNSIPVELNSDDLALLSGSSRTSTYRWLKNFEEKGIIKRNGNKIKLINQKLFQKPLI